MNEFNYVKNIAVRFGDLDTLGHVNNVAYVGYLEEARGGYYDDVVGVPFETLHTVIAMLQIEPVALLGYGQNLVGVHSRCIRSLSAICAKIP